MPGVKLFAIQAAMVAKNTDCISVLFHNGATIAKAASFAVKQKPKSLSIITGSTARSRWHGGGRKLTSLMCSAARGHDECVQILATAKADINKSGRNGITAYFYGLYEWWSERYVYTK